ncbi:winged helix-turn-helix domain-containing protein [Aeropyrum camini]|nr:winged helix-turn-helix domain-containing protein [Aeropyrum camini]
MGKGSKGGERASTRCEDELQHFLNQIMSLYQEDPKMKILFYLAELGKPASIRKIARNVRMSHKNVIKHVNALERANLVQVAYRQSNLTLYRLSDNVRLRTLSFMNCTLHNVTLSDPSSP